MPLLGPADWRLPFEPVAVLPPPTWTVPVELPAELPPLPPTEAGALTVLPAALADAAALGAPDWTLPLDPDEPLPPPTCTVPFDALAELSVPATPADVPTVAVCPAAVAVADGAAFV
jgi:hypothetical protein